MLQKNQAMRFKTGVMSLAAAACLMLSMTTAAGDGGKWVPAGSETSCPSTGSGEGCAEGTVCSEWDVEGSSTLACCIPLEALWSSDLAACM